MFAMRRGARRGASGGFAWPGLQLFQLSIPLHFGRESLAFLRAHEDGFFLGRIGAVHNVLHIARDDVFHDRNEVGVDARMPRNVLLPEMEEIGRDDMDAVRAIAGAKADDRYRQRLRQKFGGGSTAD